EESSTWSARPAGIADDHRRTNDVDLNERRPTIKQRRNGAIAMPTTRTLFDLLTTVRESLRT
ncbi:MAG TPA: hypothetical protein VF086_10160, partial [Propionibacteriaceae bacterium]